MWNAAALGAATVGGKTARGVGRSRVRQPQQKEETIVLQDTGSAASGTTINGNCCRIKEGEAALIVAQAYELD